MIFLIFHIVSSLRAWRIYTGWIQVSVIGFLAIVGTPLHDVDDLSALLTIVQALGVLKVNNAAKRLRELVTTEDAILRQVAAWALANMADAGATALLLKAADTTQDHERTKQTSACLQLAENLLALGREKEATFIYRHLRDTRNDPAEAHILEAAERGLKQAG